MPQASPSLWYRRASRSLTTPSPALRASARRGQVRRPGLEALEDRIVLAVNLLSNFSALDFISSGGYVPPDTNGAAGSAQYVETVNQSVAIYNKSNGAKIAAAPLSTFYFTTGGLAKADSGSGLSDPIVTYDEKISRFIVGDQDVNFTTHVSTFDIAVSKTSTPTTLSAADWKFYRIVTTESGFDADYPGNFGYNSDALTITLNMFGVNGGGHVQVVSVNTTDLLNQVTTPQVFRPDLNDFSVRPTTMHTSVPGGPMWLTTEHGDNHSIDVIKMTNVLSATPTFTYTTLAVTAYNSPVTPKNPGGTVITNNMDSRILKSAESNNLIVATHTVGVTSTQDAAQWYLIDVSGATPTLKDQGRVTSGAGTFSFFPSIDINASNQIGMTYMRSGTATGNFMSMYVTGRLSTDAAGTMETPVLVPAGTGLAVYKDFSSGGRAGDLSGINLDPTDGSFWAANEFANTEATANWGTAVAHFSLATPLVATDLAVSLSGPSSVDVTGGPAAVTYTITVSNNGPGDAANLVLSDILPAGSVYVSLTKSSGPDTFSFSQAGGIAKASATTVASGSVDVLTLVVTAPASLGNGAAFNNTASVAADNGETSSSNNSATVNGVIVNSNTSTDLSAKISAPSSGVEGDTFTYTITVANISSVLANGAVLTDTLDPNVAFVSATTSLGTFSFANGVVTFTIGSLAAGGSVTATVVVQAIEEGTLANNALVSSASADSDTSNNAASATSIFTEPPIVVTGPKTVSLVPSLTNYTAATFTHANGIEPASAFTALINWGDGTSSLGTITQTGATYIVTGSHVFTNGAKRHTITTTVTENGPTPNSVDVAIDKMGDERPGEGGWRQQDIVRIPARFRRHVVKKAPHHAAVKKHR